MVVEQKESTHRTIRHDQTVRLIAQWLHSNGYEKVSTMLQKQSNVLVEDTSVPSFKSAVLIGDWKTANILLESILKNESDGDRDNVRKVTPHCNTHQVCQVPFEKAGVFGISRIWECQRCSCSS
jgi:hypothetical protein